MSTKQLRLTRPMAHQRLAEPTEEDYRLVEAIDRFNSEIARAVSFLTENTSHGKKPYSRLLAAWLLRLSADSISKRGELVPLLVNELALAEDARRDRAEVAAKMNRAGVLPVANRGALRNRLKKARGAMRALPQESVDQQMAAVDAIERLEELGLAVRPWGWIPDSWKDETEGRFAKALLATRPKRQRPGAKKARAGSKTPGTR